MIKGKTKKTALIVLAATLFVAVFSVNAVAAQNLLENPGAETGDMSGWTIKPEDPEIGETWGVRDGGYEGNHSFSTSYRWCKRSQEIDLLAKGYTEAQLDAVPTISAEEWFAGYGSVWDNKSHHRDYCYLNVELRDRYHHAIASYDSGVFQTSPGSGWFGPWEQRSHIFSGYGSGLRYIYFEDGGKDREYWAGQYGPALDAASVTIAAQVPEYNVFGLLALLGILAVVLMGTLKKRKKN